MISAVETKTGVFPFHAEDMLWVIENGVKESGLKMYGDQTLRELAEETERDGLSRTAIVNDEIVGCGGIRKLWDNVGEVWLMLSPEVNKYPIRAAECILNGMQELIDENDFVRLQGWCRKDFIKAHTLFRHLGFKPEGIAEKYTPDGVDCILYARIRSNK